MILGLVIEVSLSLLPLLIGLISITLAVSKVFSTDESPVDVR